jgi:hypothetical protein
VVEVKLGKDHATLTDGGDFRPADLSYPETAELPVRVPTEPNEEAISKVRDLFDQLSDPIASRAPSMKRRSASRP